MALFHILKRDIVNGDERARIYALFVGTPPGSAPVGLIWGVGDANAGENVVWGVGDANAGEQLTSTDPGV